MTRFSAIWVLAIFLIATGCQRRSPVEIGNREQVLHRGIGHDLADLDPHLATGTSDYSVLSALFEGLVAEDPVDLHPVPGVAEAWDISPDGLRYTFHLRENARWSNGEPLRAMDFVNSIRRALSPTLTAENAAMLYLIRGAEGYARGQSSDFASVGVAARDPRTLEITLDKPTSTFLTQLVQPIWYPVPMATLAKFGPTDRRGNPWAKPNQLVGNGPFNLSDWKPNQEIVVTKSATYWDAAKVRLKEIHFHTIDSVDAEETAFRAGQLHVTDALPAGKIDIYRAERPSRLRIDPLLGTYFYRINVGRPFLGDARIRRALALAVDRTTIVDKLLRGGQMPAYSLVPEGTAGYLPATRLAFNPEAARQLLVEAGYPGGRGLPEFELTFNNSENHRLIAEAIQEMWRKELGVSAKLVNQEQTSVLELRRTGKYEILRGAWIGDYADPQTFLDVFTSGSGNNFTGWSNPSYDSLVRQASLTIDPAGRLKLFQQAEAQLLDASPIIPIYFYTHVFVIQPSVKGWHPTLLDHHPYKAVWLE